MQSSRVQPCIPSAPPREVKQRERVAHVQHVGVLGAADLVAADTDPLLDVHAARDRDRVRVAEELPGLLLDRLDLVLVRALASGHAVAAVLVLDEQRHRGEAVGGVEGVVADAAFGDAVDGDSSGLGDLPFQAVEVGVDGAGFPLGVGEDRAVQLGEAALGGEHEDGGGLDSGAEAEKSEGGCGAHRCCSFTCC
jgi:hypothetical protein